MRHLALLTFLTVDGVMQGPSSPEEDRSDGFDRGGWAAPYWEGAMKQVQAVAMNTPYDMLFGRKTYEMFASHWPDAGNDPVAEMLNAARKYVVSRSDPKLPWGPAEVVTGDLTKAVTALKSQDGALLQVHGSGVLCQGLLAAELVDELRLCTFPVTVGAGRKLFSGPVPQQHWRMTASETNAEGVNMTILKKRQG